ncbi:pyruvate phosphate dikinase chloroplastic [Phtheirospermum japonicum]|uniref:Pyruvate phosphate dikinase chloroplastic n=1 Tax=Phtheirospermum japonicum TaxID=374723 RepID=A0A830CI80_9LAMI|nr:pyruvate phosphate dikinase chloroplastic [Phtheirospermum japonicum]
MRVRRHPYYILSPATPLGPSQPSPYLNLATVGLTPTPWHQTSRETPIEVHSPEGSFNVADFPSFAIVPVVIRLLDPPLHEFLSKGDIEQIVRELTIHNSMTEDEIYSRIKQLFDVNFMLGFQGCSLKVI